MHDKGHLERNSPENLFIWILEQHNRGAPGVPALTLPEPGDDYAQY
jgi:hypothetical protein